MAVNSRCVPRFEDLEDKQSSTRKQRRAASQSSTRPRRESRTCQGREIRAAEARVGDAIGWVADGDEAEAQGWVVEEDAEEDRPVVVAKPAEEGRVGDEGTRQRLQTREARRRHDGRGGRRSSISRRRSSGTNGAMRCSYVLRVVLFVFKNTEYITCSAGIEHVRRGHLDSVVD